MDQLVSVALNSNPALLALVYLVRSHTNMAVFGRVRRI